MAALADSSKRWNIVLRCTICGPLGLLFRTSEPKAQVYYCDPMLSVVRRRKLFTFSTSPLKPLNGIQRNVTGSKILTTSAKFVFFGPIRKTRWPPWPLVAETFFVFSSETAKRNSTKLDRKQDLNVLYQVCVFWADRKNKLAALFSDWLRHFDFSSETAERNLTKLDRKQDLNVLYQVCVFRADQKNKMAALASEWLRHFSTSRLKPLDGIQRNLTGSKISTSSTTFVFFGPIEKKKQNGCPGLWFFTSPLTTAERKQDLNFLFQVCVFRDDYVYNNGCPGQSIKYVAHCTQVHVMWPVGPLVSRWAPWSLADRLRHFRLLLWNRWTEFNEAWHEARSQRPLPSLCSSGRSEKQDDRPGLWYAETFSTFPLTTAERKQDLNILFQVCVFRDGYVYNNDCPGQSIKQVAHCTQAHVMWPFGPLVYFNFTSYIGILNFMWSL